MHLQVSRFATVGKATSMQVFFLHEKFQQKTQLHWNFAFTYNTTAFCPRNQKGSASYLLPPLPSKTVSIFCWFALLWVWILIYSAHLNTWATNGMKNSHSFMVWTMCLVIRNMIIQTWVQKVIFLDMDWQASQDCEVGRKDSQKENSLQHRGWNPSYLFYSHCRSRTLELPALCQISQ